LRLSRREEMWNTAEILILRHQLAVLQRRQPRRPKLDWADRALLAALLGVIPKARRQGLRLLVTPDTIVRWHRDIVRRRWAPGPRAGGPGGQRPGAVSGHWSGGWLARTATGDTAGSMASSPTWGLRSQRQQSGRSSRPAAPAPADGRPGRPGHNSCAPRPRRSWRGLLHGRPARRHPGLCPDGNRARDPAHPDPRHHPPSHRRMDRPASPQPPHGP
jgi:hypothetical protein